MSAVYISPSGNDSTGTGTHGNPWQTMAKAYASTITGDTIICLAGTFAWASQIYNSGGRNIIGAGATQTIFDGGGASVGVNQFWNFGAASTFNITGIKFQNVVLATASFAGIFGLSAPAPWATVNFNNCIFTNFNCAEPASGFAGVFFNQQSNVFTFTSCLFYNIFATTNNANSQGFLMQNAASPVPGISFLNCTYHSNQSNVATLAFTQSLNGALAVSLTNCIFFDAGGSNPSLTNTNLSFSGTNNDLFGYSSVPSLPNQLGSDPLFVDATNGNFNLRPTSPCIGAGTMI